jgi:hypothetical protein
MKAKYVISKFGFSKKDERERGGRERRRERERSFKYCKY